MKPLCNLDPHKPPFIPVPRTRGRGPLAKMPVRHASDIIGLEAYHLAASLRDIADIFSTPAHVLVLHHTQVLRDGRWTFDQTGRHVRVQVPNPTGPHFAHWAQHVCHVFGWDAFTSRSSPSVQVFYLGRVVDPDAFTIPNIPTDAVTYSRPPKVQPTCEHGVPIAQVCQACDEWLPW